MLAAPASSARSPKVTKRSIGIIICRMQEGRPEVILVKKRFTYAYIEFIHGKYTPPREADGARRVAELLGRMTREELNDVWSLNFEQMWYRAWPRNNSSDDYAKQKAKFMHSFINDDGGEWLHSTIRLIQTKNELLWEVPRGRPQHREKDIDCAVREVREEAGIKKNAYRIIPGAKRLLDYISGGVRYICSYYIAIAGPELARAPLRLPFDPDETETIDVGWYSIEALRRLGGEGPPLAPLVAPAFRVVKKYLKGKWGNCGKWGILYPPVLPHDEGQKEIMSHLVEQ